MGSDASPLADLTVVMPVGPGDTPAAELCGDLEALPAEAQLRVVTVAGDDVARATAACTARWQCLTAPRGRAAQQNAGTGGATRSWLWFLHADSRLAATTLPALAAFLADGRPALGFFDLRFHDGPALMRLNALGARLRSRALGLPFGDQGLVLPSVVFAELGGFDTTLACGEDHDLVWRARRRGVPLRPVGAPLSTSARKYAEQGWWRTTAGTMGETWRQARRFSRAAAER